MSNAREELEPGQRVHFASPIGRQFVPSKEGIEIPTGSNTDAIVIRDDDQTNLPGGWVRVRIVRSDKKRSLIGKVVHVEQRYLVKE